MTALSASGPAFAVDKVFNTEKAEVRVTTFADGLTEPWGLAALPDGGFLVTEKQGNLRFVTSGGKLSEPLKGVPKVDSRGRAVCSTWRSTRSSSGTGWSISAIPNRERAATRPPWRAAC